MALVFDLHVGDDGQAHVAAKFMQHQQMCGAHNLERAGPVERMVQHDVDAVFGKLPQGLTRRHDAVNHHVAVERRNSHGFQHALAAGFQAKHAGIVLLLGEPLGVVGSDVGGVNAKLLEAIAQQRAAALIQID